jgi:hypothetical protein
MTGTKGSRSVDRQQDAPTDKRQGAYDPVGNQTKPDASAPTPQEKAQPGSAMQGESVPVEDFELPEGLKRQPMGPYSKDKGRAGRA